jgi:hypothetical protein
MVPRQNSLFWQGNYKNKGNPQKPIQHSIPGEYGFHTSVSMQDRMAQCIFALPRSNTTGTILL